MEIFNKFVGIVSPVFLRAELFSVIAISEKYL